MHLKPSHLKCVSKKDCGCPGKCWCWTVNSYKCRINVENVKQYKNYGQRAKCECCKLRQCKNNKTKIRKKSELEEKWEYESLYLGLPNREERETAHWNR